MSDNIEVALNRIANALEHLAGLTDEPKPECEPDEELSGLNVEAETDVLDRFVARAKGVRW